MPIFIQLANLIFSKKALQEKYPGGIAQFKADSVYEKSKLSAEDDHLINLPAMNVEDFDLSPFIKHLHWDEESQSSQDFVAIARYSGPIWQTEWIEMDDESYPTLAWHANCNPAIKARGKRVATTPMDEMEAILEKQQMDLVKWVEKGS